jgi:hypothetical protein
MTFGAFTPVWAGFSYSGYDLQVVQAEKGLAHTAIDYQTNGLWSRSGRDVNMSTSFALPSAESIRFARLYLDIWGGKNTYTATITASLNGTPITTVTIGGSASESLNTTNIFDVAKTCVYGSGSGMWQVAFSGVSGLLAAGAANTLDFTVSDPNDAFDGRTICASLVTVYSDPKINQTLDYYLAEADGTLRKTAGNYGSPSERSLAFTDVDVTNAISATYHAGYTHGTTGEKDRIYFNEVAMGGNDDVAIGTSSDYGPSNHIYDVKNLLASSSTVRYSVSAADVGSIGEGYLRTNIGLLEVTHAVPEPGAMVLLGTAAMAISSFLLKRRGF